MIFVIHFLFLAVSAIAQDVTPNIINLHLIDSKKWLKEPGNIYIGRKNAHISFFKWGNPFKINAKISRIKAISLFENYLQTNKELLDTISELKGKKLGCWCAPLPCHGEILHRLAGNHPVYDKLSLF